MAMDVFVHGLDEAKTQPYFQILDILVDCDYVIDFINDEIVKKSWYKYLPQSVVSLCYRAPYQSIDFSWLYLMHKEELRGIELILSALNWLFSYNHIS